MRVAKGKLGRQEERGTIFLGGPQPEAGSCAATGRVRLQEVETSI
jgi:hypothetical protein